MERHSWCSTNSGVLVEKEVTVHIDHNGSGSRPRSYQSSVASVVCSIAYPERETRSPELFRNITPPPSDNTVSHSGMAGPRSESQPRERRLDDSIPYLVKIFEQHPPEGCTPKLLGLNDTSSEDERRKRFRLFHKARKRKFALPDSAIPATTIAGHKHIAISIPSECSYLNLIPGSKSTQDPTPQDTESRHELDRRFSSSDYSTRRLSPITEDQNPQDWVSLQTEFQREIERRFSSEFSPTRLSPVTEEQEPIISGSHPELLSRVTTQFREPQPTTAESNSSELLLQAISADFQELQVQWTGLNQEMQSQNPAASQGHMSLTREELKGESEAGASTPNPRGAETPHSGNYGMCVTYSSESSTQQKSSSEPTGSPGRSSIERSKATSSAPPTKIKMIPPPQLLIEDGEDSGYDRASFDERLLSTEPLPEVHNTQAGDAARMTSVVAPASQQDGSYSDPLMLSDSLKQPENQVNCSILTEKPREVQKPKKAKVERIKIRLRPESFSDSNSQDLQLGPKDGHPKSTVSSNLAQDSGVVCDINSLPPELNTKQGKEGNSQELNDDLLPGPVSDTGHIEGSSNDEKSTLNHPSSLPVSPPSSGNPIPPEKHEEKPRKSSGEKYPNVLPEGVKEQSGVDLGGLSRQELVLEVERLREIRLKDMDKRLRRLERHSERWIRSMVPLMENLNKLLEEQNRLLQSTHTKSQGPDLPRRRSRQERQPRVFDPLGTPSRSPPAPDKSGISCRRAHSISGEQYRPHRRRSPGGRIVDTDCSQSPTLIEESQANFQDGTPRNVDYHEGIVEKRRTELEERIGRTGAVIKTAVEASAESAQRYPQNHQDYQNQQGWLTETIVPNGSGRSDRSRSESTSSSHSRSTYTIFSSDEGEQISNLETDEDQTYNGVIVGNGPVEDQDMS